MVLDWESRSNLLLSFLSNVINLTIFHIRLIEAKSTEIAVMRSFLLNITFRIQ